MSKLRPIAVVLASALFVLAGCSESEPDGELQAPAETAPVVEQASAPAPLPDSVEADTSEPEDEFDSLAPGEGREETYGTCLACHSSAIIRQQRLTRVVWGQVLDDMVEEMGMGEPLSEDREKMLDYLAEHYGPDLDE
jgi:hypothetical protein